MPRPHLRPYLAYVLALAAGSALVEVGLRADPRLGYTRGETLAWLGVNAGITLGWLLPASLAAYGLGRRPWGLALAAVAFVHAALAWRFDLYLNEFLYDPRVWGGLLAIGLGCLGLGLGLDRLLSRHWRSMAALSLVLGVAGAGRALTVAGSRPDRAAAVQGPSVLLVTLDTTRPDVIGAYGSGNATPAMDGLARDGVLFEQAISTAPLTEPSHLAILTGIPPYVSGVVSNGTDLGEQPALLSRVLQAEGVATAAFVSAFPLHGRYGWPQGFDVYDDDFGDLPGLHRLSAVKAWDQVALPAHALRERRGDGAVRRAARWLGTHRDERFFLWVHLFDPHAPYEAPGHPFDPPTDGAPLELPGYWPPPHKAITSTDWLTEAYEAEVRYTDALVGELLAALEGAGRADDTVVVLTADHGESLTEHGYLFDHGDFLYDASLRVPLLVRLPQGLGGAPAAGTRVPCQVSNLDVTPTLLDLLAVDDDQPRQGRSLARLLRGGPCEDAPVVSSTVAGRFVEVPPIDHALRDQGQKLIRHEPRAPGEPVRRECFDLAADPGEDRPLSDCAAPLAAALDGALEAGAAPVSPRMDAETRHALEALGYIE